MLCASLAAFAAAGEAVPARAVPARASAASAPAVSPFAFQATFGAGYDTNVSRLPDTAANSTSAHESPLATGSASLTWRPATGSLDRTALSLYGAYDRFTKMQSYDASVAGLRGAWQRREGSWIIGGVVDARRHWLDQQLAAAVLSAGPRASLVGDNQVLSLSIDGQRQTYDRRIDTDGWVVDDALRWWYLPESGIADRRIEVLVRHTEYWPHDRWLGYTGIAPGIGAAWRFGAARALGTCEASVGVAVEHRTYRAPDPGSGTTERRQIPAAQGGVQVWIDARVSVGVLLRWTEQDSNVNSNDYDRTQAIGNVNVQW